MVIRIFCKKIDLYDRDRFDSFSAHNIKATLQYTSGAGATNYIYTRLL